MNFSFFSKKRRSTSNRHIDLSSLKNKRDIYKKNKASKPLSRTQKRFLKFLFLFAIILTFIFLLFASPFFKIQNIDTIRKSLSIDTESIEIFLSEKVIHRNIFLLKIKNIESEVKKAFPQWKDISIEKQFPKTLIVNISNYPAFANVKVQYPIPTETEEIDLEQSILQEKTQKTFDDFIVEEYNVNILGNIVSPDLNEVPAYTIILKDNLEKKPFLNEELIPKKHIKDIQKLTNDLLEFFNLATKEIHYFSIGKEVHINTFQFSIWIDLQQDIEKQVKKLRMAIENTQEKSVEYFDLRIKNRIIYKEKEL